jgi:hypothetical protein
MKNKVFIISAMVLIVSTESFAQSKLGRYHKNLLYEADLYYLQGDYYYASELYSEVLKAEPDNAETLGKLGMAYFKLPTFKDRAESYLELAAAGNNNEAMFYLAQLRHENYRFHDALELIGKYKAQPRRIYPDSEVDRFYAIVNNAIGMVKTPVPVTITNMGPNVNSNVHDYAPVWDKSGNRILFTSRRKMDEKSEKDFSEQFDENIYEIDLAAINPEARPANEPLNSRTNDAAIACSADGNQLIVYRTSKDGLSGDLYIAEKMVDQWSDLKKLDNNINSKYQEASATFGNAEGTTLYFSSDRPGGLGGKDIYLVNRLPDGSWGEPMNLGEPVNTPYDDDAPFVDSEGGLYFASMGHNGMGGFDIFYSAPAVTTWSTPVNIGYPINTPGDDIFFTMNPSGKIGYFSSDRYGGRGLQDLYKIVFDEVNTLVCKIQIETEGEKLPPVIYLKLVNDETGAIEGYFQSETASKSAIIPLKSNKKFTLHVEAEGFTTLQKSLFFEGGDVVVVEKIEKLMLSAH